MFFSFLHLNKVLVSIVTAFILILICLLICVISIVSLFVQPVVTKFKFNQLRELKPSVHQQRGHRDVDRADITFDLEADLSSVFNW